MRMLAILGLAASFSVLAFGGAEAQQKVRIYKYCLEEARSFFGSNQTLCRFDTIAQCNASKNSLADRCVENVYRQRP